MKYFYCKSWFRAKKVATEIWSSATAEVAHSEGKLYTVLVNSETHPTAFVEVTKNTVSVGFLDERLREKLSYAFIAVGGGRIFLSMATYRDFQGDSDALGSGTSYVFQESGSVSIKRQTFSPPASQVTDSTTDVSGNYSLYPIFGRYDDLLRVERP